MRVLLTGAYGLLGAAIAARLHRDGHEVIGVGRALGAARRRIPFVHWVEADFARLTSTEAWRPLIANVDAVVNCAGALQSGVRDDLTAVHVGAPRALFEACAQYGPRRIVQMSAIGARRDGPTAFARTKAEADDALAASDLDWIVLRPGLVLADNVYGATAMLRGLAGLPWIVPLFAPRREIGIIMVDDVAATVAWSLTTAEDLRQVLELVHPQPTTIAAIVAEQRAWLGSPPARIVEIPDLIVKAVAAVADGLGRLGWRSPARSTALAQIIDGITGDPTAWVAATGIRPKGHAAFLAERPATLPDRWFARLYWIKPLAIAVLSAFWIVTGLIALGPGYAPARAYLAEAGVAPSIAISITIGGALFDILLGGMLIVRRTAHAALVTMLAVTPFYLLAGTVLAPELWSDPLGPYTKVIPLLVATLFTLAVLDER